MTDTLIRVRLVRSPIGYSQKKKDTVRSLGFTRMQQVRTLPDNASVRGMIQSIGHMLQVLESGEGAEGTSA